LDRLNLLKHFNEDFGQAIVMVSYEPDHTKYFDSVIRLRDGLVETKGKEKLLIISMEKR
jgi:ABC-type lipoprotein export system ATPase subunit